MRKTMLALTLALAVSTCARASVVPPAAVVDGQVTVTVNGARIDTYGLARRQGGEVVVPLRPVSQALGATSVMWDPEADCVRVTAPGLELWVPFYKEYAEANGRCWYIPGGVDTVNDRTLVPLDFLLWAFGAKAASSGQYVELTPTGKPLVAAESFYDSDDLYWLSHIIYAEAGNQPLVGQIAVGNVVINRTYDDEFPGTIKAVIFDRRYGVQFTPAYSGSIDMSPSSDSVAAAKLALEGFETVDGALYFTPVRAAGHCWASRHCPVVAEIADHVFFGDEIT